MSRDQASKTAFAYFNSGFHCAEAISKAIVGLYGDRPDAEEVQRYAAGVMGGIGGTRQETCGALTGGIVAIGCLHGRREAGRDNQRVKHLASEFRRRFVEKFGSGTCCVILDGMDKREDGFDCKKLTADAAGLLAELLMERHR